MNFITPGLALFLVPAFLLYWLVFSKNVQFQNVFLFLASIVFYSFFDWKATSILIISIGANFYLGKAIDGSEDEFRRSFLFVLIILFNLGLLVIFKYFGVFGKWVETGPKTELPSGTNLIMPVGISFYTFQILGYVIDIYYGRIKSCDKLLLFATYVSWFPKIIAGPIEPAASFLKQVEIKRNFHYELASDGMRQILWGIFIKLVISNNCVAYSRFIFGNIDGYPGSTLLLGAFFSIIQIYTDFAGYSNIAIGVSKLFGIGLSRNFRAPFFATSIRDYWQRWHMTLTGWMIKYVYTPLAFHLRKLKKAGLVIAVIVTFTLIGLWHGANWTFVIFGLLHGLYFIPVIIFSRRQIGPSGVNKFLTLTALLKRIALFVLIMLTAIFFASSSVQQAITYFKGIFSPSVLSAVVWPPTTGLFKTITLLGFILLMFCVEWKQQHKAHELDISDLKSTFTRHTIYLVLLALILFFGSIANLKFEYAQF